MTKRRTVQAEERAIKKASMRRGRDPNKQMDAEYEKERAEILDKYRNWGNDELERPTERD
jgi:hypothetical protein